MLGVFILNMIGNPCHKGMHFNVKNNLVLMKILKFFGLLFSFLLFIPACGTGIGWDGAVVGVATTYEVGSIADSRFRTGTTLDGAAMTATRNKLLAPDNFGQNGTVPSAINITDTASTQGSITAALLSNFDVFFIGSLNDTNPNAFTAGELNALQDWVRNNGGVLIITCDDSSFDDVCEFFGYPASSSGITPTVPAAAGVGHPLFDGAFGTVASVSMGGVKGFFPTTTDAEVLGEDSAGTPAATVIERQIDNGWIIFLSDVDMITELGGISAGTEILNDNDRFLGNLFDYAAGIL
jgi:hypothetical protein